MHLIRSVRLGVFVLIAALMASGVAATVWAQSGGGTASPTASQQVGPLGTIVIVKDAVPDDPYVFNFSLTGFGAFSLDDDPATPLPNTQTFANLQPGLYTVTELFPITGWWFRDSVCKYPDGSTTAFGSQATINLAAGATVTCTFTNYKMGRVIVDKVTIPAGDPTVFQFNSAWGNFSLTDTAPPYDSGPIPPTGGYLLNETLPSGWTLASVVCKDPDGGTTVGPTAANPTLPATSAIIDLDPGETVFCTYTNTKTSGGGSVGPDLSITKVGVVSADGQTVTYTVTVTNIGNMPAINPVVDDSLISPPPGAQFLSATGTGWTCLGAPGPGPVNCTYAGILAPADPALTITIVVDIGPSGGKFENCAIVSHMATAAVPPDSNLANNKACVTTSVKPKPVPTTAYIYSVKIVCGTVTPPRPKPSIPTLRDPAPVVPGLYRTAVNIHNFWEKETTFLQKVAIALPQDQPRGPVTKKIQAKLGPNEAVEVDCYNVVAILDGTTSAKAEFLKGFVVIESPVELEVTAVYTAEELQENGISIDVEQIQPHVIRPRASDSTPVPAPGRP